MTRDEWLAILARDKRLQTPGTDPQKDRRALIAAVRELQGALKGVVRVADRATDEFDAAREGIATYEEPSDNGSSTQTGE